MGFGEVKGVNPQRWKLVRGVETPPLGSDDCHVQNALHAEAEAVLFQVFCHALLTSSYFDSSLASCPWQREGMDDAGSKIS